MPSGDAIDRMLGQLEQIESVRAGKVEKKSKVSESKLKETTKGTIVTITKKKKRTLTCDRVAGKKKKYGSWKTPKTHERQGKFVPKLERVRKR